MSTAEVIQRWIDAINRQDVEAYSSLYAPTAIVRDPQYPHPLEGRDAIREDIDNFFRAFPDLNATVRSTMENGNTYAFEGTFSGTNKGPLALDSGDLPPTGNRVEFTGAGFVRIDGQGRILEESRYYDLAGLFAQLGV